MVLWYIGSILVNNLVLGGGKEKKMYLGLIVMLVFAFVYM